MVYRAEVVIPSDVVFGSPRVEHFDQSLADHARSLETNCIEEKRLYSCLRTAKYFEVMQRYYNKNIKDLSFMVSDLVLKCTSYPCPRRDLLWSPKSRAQPLTGSLTQTEQVCLTPST